MNQTSQPQGESQHYKLCFEATKAFENLTKRQRYKIKVQFCKNFRTYISLFVYVCWTLSSLVVEMGLGRLKTHSSQPLY